MYITEDFFFDKLEKKYEEKRRINTSSYLKSTLEKRSDIFPYGFWNKTPDPLFIEPVYSIIKKWPNRSLLMLRALDIINNFSNKNNSLNVLEIGSGPAILAGLMMYKMNTFHILVDLPEQIVTGFSFLSQYFPEKKILLPDEVSKNNIDSSNADVIFITPEQMNLIKNAKFDITVNMFSFQEMSYDAINEYFKFIRAHSVKNNMLYCINRISKLSVHDNIKIEFDKYPWKSDDVFVHEKIFDGFLGKMPIGEGKIKECVVNLK